MVRLIRFELFKMARRPRSWLGFGGFLFINICVMLGLKYGHLETFASHGASAQGFTIVGSPINAEFQAWMAVGSPLAGPILLMFMPFFVALVFGEIHGGESTEGTLRTALTRPVTRTGLFGAKFIASLIYALALVLFLGISGYLIGLLWFGRGGLLATGTFRNPMLASYPELQGLGRLALAYLLTTVAMVTVGMIALFISTWLNSPLGAIGGSIMLLFTMSIVGEIPWFAPIRDYLFSTHLMIGQEAFLDPIPWHGVGHSLVCLGAYIIAFLIASLLIFRRKDILA